MALCHVLSRHYLVLAAALLVFHLFDVNESMQRPIDVIENVSS